MIVRHPTLNVEREVPDHKADEWIAAGWVAQSPEPPAEPKPVAKPRTRRK